MPGKRNRPHPALLLSLIGLVAVVLPGCLGLAEGSTEPPPEVDATISATISVWAADGVLDYGEYDHTAVYQDYEIQWASGGDYIYIGMRAPTRGWVAVGFKPIDSPPSSAMNDADMIFGLIKDGQAKISDQLSTGPMGPHIPDTELLGTNDVAEFGGAEEGGYTTIEFKRALITDDEFDHDLEPGIEIPIIWSYSESDSLAAKHAISGYGVLTP